MKTIKRYTDLSQSKVLAKILPIESADMVYIDVGYSSRLLPKDDIDANTYPVVVSCWSLAALLDVLPKGNYKDTNLCYGGLTINDYVDEWFCSYQQPEPMVMLHTHADNPIDACYEMILKLHEQKLL